MSAYLPPVPIDPVTFSWQPASNNPFTGMISGPYSFGGALYIVLQVDDGTFNSVAINCWKSTDNGQTWASLDSGNAPTAGSFEAAFDGAQTISVVHQLQPGNGTVMNVTEFDLGTETWGAPSGNSPETGYGVYFVGVRSDGSLLVAYAKWIVVGANGKLQGVTFSAGLWGIPFQVDSDAKAAFPAALGPLNLFGCVDADDTTHLFFSEGDLFGVSHLFYQAVNMAGFNVNFNQFADADTAMSLNVSTSYGIPCIEGADIVFPLFQDIGGVGKLSLFIGTPRAAPVWTLFSNIDPTAEPDAALQFASPAAQFDAGVVNIVTLTPTADSAFQAGIARISSTSDFVTWVFASVQTFDVQNDPHPLMGSPSMAGPLLGQGGGLTLTGLDPTLTFGQSFWFAGAAAPLSFACGGPPNGTIGVPYTHTFPAAGGTPPYSFAITVPALPPGITLNAATGTISGTPTTAGAYTFSVTVTDSAAASVTVACGFSIAGLPVRITLRGVNRRRCTTPEEPEVYDVPNLPSVDRAI